MKVLFVTFDKCPKIDAGAVRTHTIAKMFADEKHEVTVLSMGPYNDGKALLVDGIEYISFRPKKGTFLNKALAYVFFPYKVKHHLKKKNYDICIHTQVDKQTLNVLINYAKLRKASIVYDAVEWFSPEQFSKGESAHAYKLNNNYNTKYIRGSHKVIAISSYLFDYFTSRRISTILMPVVLDVNSIRFDKHPQSDIKTIIYAGAPGKKDYLDVIIKGISLLDVDEQEKLNLRIIGCTKEQFLSSTSLEASEIDQVEKCVRFMGRISRDAVIDEYTKADFSVLIRSQSARYAQAGFPTKLVESLSAATPVMCNYTSDIDKYIKHLNNGVVVNGEDEYACVEALRCIIRLKKEDVIMLQKNARETAVRCFDYHLYSKALIYFIKG